MPKAAEIVDIQVFLMRDEPADRSIAICNGTLKTETNKYGGDYIKAVWIWLPRSMIEYEVMPDREYRIADRMVPAVIVTLPAWLAEKEGLDNDVIGT